MHTQSVHITTCMVYKYTQVYKYISLLKGPNISNLKNFGQSHLTHMFTFIAQ